MGDLCVEKSFIFCMEEWIRKYGTLASAGRSNTTYFGLPMVSMKIALVFSSIAFANDSGAVSVTQLIPMPNFLKVTMKEGQCIAPKDGGQLLPLNWLYV